MPPRPYDKATRKKGRLTFVADLPAFAVVGRNFKTAKLPPQLSLADQAPGDLATWRRFKRKLKTQIELLRAKRKKWREALAELLAEFPDQLAFVKNWLLPASVVSSPKYMRKPRLLSALSLEQFADRRPSDISFGAVLADCGSVIYAKSQSRIGTRQGTRRALPPPDERTACPLRFDCGPRRELTPEQTAAFDLLQRKQRELAVGVAAALCELCAWIEEQPPSRGAPPDFFLIDTVYLAGDGRIGFTFDSKIGHYNEHGCGVVIQNGRVTDYGDAEVLFDLEED